MATNITEQKRQKLWQQTLLNKNDRNKKSQKPIRTTYDGIQGKNKEKM